MLAKQSGLFFLSVQLMDNLTTINNQVKENTLSNKYDQLSVGDGSKVTSENFMKSLIFF